MELASVILQDPSLTVKLLKISNSPNYNPSRQKMVTVSRAIIMIGSERIRELTLICSFFETVLSPSNKGQVNREIARAIHAAVQAKYIAITVNDSSPEEVFIATLLNHIGSISFWCFCSKQCEQIQSLVGRSNCSFEDAEKQVLGFKLKDLGYSLSKSWKLGGLIEEAYKLEGTPRDPRVGLVQIGIDIAEALKEGSGSVKFANCIKKIVAITGQSRQAVIDKLKENTTAAAKIAYQLGATDAAKLLQGDKQSSLVGSEEVSNILDKKQIQLQISQDIMSIISEHFDMYLLLKTVLEGIHRGIGMDRTIFSVLSNDRLTLKERLSLGWRKESLDIKVVFNVSSSPVNLFNHALSTIQAFWAKPTEHEKLFTLRDTNVIGKNECFMMPITSGKSPIGLIYADRWMSKEPLTEEDFIAFKYFAQQANIGLTIYRSQR